MVLSYSTVVLYIEIIKYGYSGPKILLQHQLNIYILTVVQHWLGIAKCLQINPKPFHQIVMNFKNFVFNVYFY